MSLLRRLACLLSGHRLLYGVRWMGIDTALCLRCHRFVPGVRR